MLLYRHLFESWSMRKLTIFIAFFIALSITIASINVCFAWPSRDFHQEEDDIFDDWQVCRTNAYGEGGFYEVMAKKTKTEIEFTFTPFIAFESLGEYADSAYKLGEQFAEKYRDHHQRAEKIFKFVQDKLQYVPDIDVFDMEDYAQNADEVANAIMEDGFVYSDCDEHAVLLAIMYQGAGYRSAIVLCPGHSAVLVHLPEYEKANVQFSIDGEWGWIWAESTGDNTRLGWCPIGLIEEPILAYEISANDSKLLPEPSDKE